MCIGIWTLEHPDYALIICTNRDEYLDRPTQDAHFHSFQDDHHRQNPSSVSGDILSGRDDKAGGSWFGLNRAGRVALLTNITETPKSFTSSRGYLVSSFLLSDSSHPLEDEVGKIVPQDAKFAGFNLLLLAPAPLSSSSAPEKIEITEGRVGEREPEKEKALVKSRKQKLAYDAIFVTNHGAGGRLNTRRLTSAERFCGCMSNGIDGQGGDEWPKVQRATRDFKEVLKSLSTDGTPRSEKELIESLFDILTWRSPEPITQRAQLRNTVQVDPIPIVLDPPAAVLTTPSSNFTSSLAIAATPSAPSAGAPESLDAKPQYRLLAPTAPGYENYYGTRLSTVLLVRRDGSVLLIERDIWRLGKSGKPERLNYREKRGVGDVKERCFEFKLDWKS
ncbi:hypothetical protein P691DRAFT_806522 [Macrolepiota fuliginosa MF-IS2]|uniref:DUF833-domain-containing protein n=1 Tax=Macrolepiota fuliginosa MF-IS2 TaxID=1400762 RepID=A0A9P5XJ70_9AGAR|nr:hypothetical protein P691DRAFT_806522 [Macrolepiota fuliginosa MF-IS2]